MQSLEALAKSGAIVSTAGVGLLVAFVGVLLAFPVAKECDGSDCSYSSSAPDPFKSIVQPGFLAVSLALIAAGVLMVRVSRWRDKKTEGGA